MQCLICKKTEAVSREGWCRPCLRVKLAEKFGWAGHSNPKRGGTGRTGDHKQAYEGDANPFHL